MTEPAIRTAAFLSPSWPPATATNGIVASLGKFRPGLQSLGVRVPVFAQRMDQSAQDAEHDVVDLTAYQSRSIPGQFIQRVRHRFQPVHGIVGRLGSALLAAIRAQSGMQLDVLELEDTFGIAARIQPRVQFPVVVRLHGPWFLTGELQGASQRQRAYSERLNLEGKGLVCADGISSPSRFVLDSTIDRYALDSHCTAVIPNAQRARDPRERWEQRADRKRTILFVGRFDALKGGDLVVDAFSQLAKEDSELQLYFIGPDDGVVDSAGRCLGLQAYLQQRVDASTVATRVKYLGVMTQAEVSEWRRRASLTVISSRYETFPNTALEAMSQGCPIVASDAGGIPEIIQDGKTGLIFRSGQVEDLARKCIELLNNPDLATQLGARAIVECERRFNPDDVARQTLDFYRTVARTRHQQSRQRRRAPRFA